MNNQYNHSQGVEQRVGSLRTPPVIIDNLCYCPWQLDSL